MSRAARALREALEHHLQGEARARLQRMRDADDFGEPTSRRQGRWLMSEGAAEALAEARAQGELGQQGSVLMEQQLRFVEYGFGRRSAERVLRRGLGGLEDAIGAPLRLEDLLPQIASADDEKRRGEEAQRVERALRPLAEQYAEASARAERPFLERVEQAPSPPVYEPPRSAGGLLLASSMDEAIGAAAALDLPGLRALAPQASAAKDSARSGDKSSAGRRFALDDTEMDAVRHFLHETQAALEDAVRFCARGFSAEFPLPWDVLLRALRGPELDSDSGARQRWRRVARWLRGLGFEREMGARLRAEVDRGGLLPVATHALCQLPREVRVAQMTGDLGVASDLFAAGGVGSALGWALVTPSLPAERRWPLLGGCARALGGLAVELWADRQHLERIQGMSGPAAERVGRLAATILLVSVRFDCALSLVELDPEARVRDRLGVLADALSKAVGASLPPSIAGLLAGDRVAARARARAALSGLALHVVLRERFDEDFFRNPRVAEPLRVACGRGNGLDGGAFCAELGGTLEAAADRIHELL
ncbi:MAG: hypothetical protein OEZ06_10770 [Myxococcales bacterium]|nr:hypothetical protein [Myxococcales bacterium]